MAASCCLWSFLPCAKISLDSVRLFFVHECVQRALFVTFAAVDIPVSQCSRCDVKRNPKVYANVTCGEIVPQCDVLRTIFSSYFIGRICSCLFKRH